MTTDITKQEIYEIVKDLPISEANRQFFRGHIMTVLGEKYSYRQEHDEGLFGKLIDEVIDKKLSDENSINNDMNENLENKKVR